MKDEQKLSEYIKEDDDTIHLIVRSNQASPPSPSPSTQPQAPSQPAPTSAPAPEPAPNVLEGENIGLGQLPAMFSGMIQQLMPQAQALASRLAGITIPANQPRVIFSTFEAPMRPPPSSQPQQPPPSSAPAAGESSAPNVPRVSCYCSK